MSDKKSKETAQRLLEAAMSVFAEHGFDGASTRMLVNKAGVNISAIPYYFGSKDGLYEAVIEHIISTVKSKQGPKAHQIQQALNKPDLTQAEAQELLHDFVASFIDILLSQQMSPSMVEIFIREQIHPSCVFERFYIEMLRPTHETLTRLTAFLIGEDAGSIDAILCTQTILGQFTIFKTHQELLLRRTGWKHYGASELNTIKRMVLHNIDSVIDANKKEKS